MMYLVSSFHSLQLSSVVEWTPMNVLLAVLCVYSLVVNYSFGHPTYWRRSRSLGKLSTLTVGDESIPHAKVSPKHTAQNMELVLHIVDQDTLLHIWSYFTPHGLTITSQLSRSYRELSQHKSLWRLHTSRLPVLKQPFHPTGQPRMAYFQRLTLVIEEMLRDDDKLIIQIDGDLYDLTYFVHEHPGGDGVLTEYRGRDATVMFERVTHSAVALQIRENLLLFSPKEYKGATGWPVFYMRSCS